MNELTCWRTDIPCPQCGAALVLLDDGGAVLRTECRSCGHVCAGHSGGGAEESPW